MIGADRFIGYLDADRQTLHATQRYQRGYSDIDLWNLDTFIADIIVAGCDWYLAGKSVTTGPSTMSIAQWHNCLKTVRDGFARDIRGGVSPPAEAWATLRQIFGMLWD